MRWMWVLLALGCTASPGDKSVDTDVPEDPSGMPVQAYDPLELVDPFVGTGGNGAEIANVNPGASMPFGMTLVGPDTRTVAGAPSFYHCAGYWWHDTHLYGFSHTHAHGMGVPDYGTVAFMPRDGWRDDYIEPSGRMAPFSHDEEWARAGSYSVVLQDSGTRVDIAASVRGAHTRITWQEGAEPVLMFDLGHALSGTSVVAGEASYVSDEGVLRGFHQSSGGYSSRFGGVKSWFEATFDPQPIATGGWSGGVVQPDASSVEGTSAGLWLTFPEGTTVVEMRLAISSVDAQGAQQNLAEELNASSFEEQVARAEDAWREHLGRVRVRGGSDEERMIFHSALYHASLMPSRHDDVDGRYRGVDQEIRTADHPYYSDLSLWDTFRTLHPWYILAWPEVQTDVLASLLRMYDDGGSLARWPMAHGYTSGMVGTPAIQLFSESWLKGLTDFDTDKAFEASYRAATQPMDDAGRRGLSSYLERGYVGVEDASGSVSRTLEFAWSDHALARWAEAMGREEAAGLYAQANGWEGLWNEDVGFLTGRCLDPENPECGPDGFVWTEGALGPVSWETHFVEGNAWHYLWYVPYDIERMVEVQHDGDLDAWAARYASYWDEVFREDDDILPDDYYWHGNEPVMHAAFLGSLAGLPDLTSDPARWVLANRYAHDPIGLDGNDDSGTLSAWYLWAAVGWFPVAGTDDYAMASPLFERVEVDQPDGTTWVMRAPGTSDARRYVADLTIGGERITSSVVDHATLMSGEVVFDLSDQPGGWAGR